MTSIRIFFNPFSLDIEYHAKTFPVDPYGFTVEDRMRWGTISLEYITSNAPLFTLADLQFPDGTPLYNERELSHMEDVQIVYQRMVIAWTIISIILLGLLGAAWIGKWLSDYGHILCRGGMVTIILIFTILMFVIISFDKLFSSFHSLFFESGSWLFYYSDTLIRLFPVRLWQDFFIFTGVLTAIMGIIFWFGGGLLSRKAVSINQ